MTDPIQSIVSKYQKAVAGVDGQAVKRLTDSYLRSYQLIQADAQALIEKALREGVMSPSSLRKLTEYKRVMADVRAELGRYGVVVDDVVASAQAQAAEAGAKAGSQMILDMFPESAQASIQAVLQRMPKEAVTAMVGALQEQSPLASKTLARWGDMAAKSMGEQLVKGLTMGVGSRKTAREIMRSLDPILGMPLTKALTIARTETNRAFRYATRATYEANPHIVKDWVWMSAINSGPCLACLAMHGTKHSMSESLDDHPNGRCTMAPIVPTFRELGLDVDEPIGDLPTGKQVFDGMSEAEQRAMMGNTRYEAYKAGKFAFEDMAQTNHSDEWGDSVGVKPLIDL